MDSSGIKLSLLVYDAAPAVRKAAKSNTALQQSDFDVTPVSPCQLLT
jgi:hypothetical protein